MVEGNGRIPTTGLAVMTQYSVLWTDRYRACIHE